METTTIELFAKVAGIAGLSLAVFLILFKNFIKATFLPKLEPEQAYKLLRLFLFLTSGIAIFGMSIWIFNTPKSDKTQEPKKIETTYKYDHKLDEIVTDLQSEIDLFLIDIKGEHKEYHLFESRYNKIESKLNSIQVRLNALSEAQGIDENTPHNYNTVQNQIQIMKRNFSRLKEYHESKNTLSPIFIDEVRKIYNDFSEQIQRSTIKK